MRRHREQRFFVPEKDVIAIIGAMTSFPDGFLWGAASAAHQNEGGNVNADLWPQEWAPNSGFSEPSGDACDSYHR